MELKDIPKKDFEWIKRLKSGSTTIEEDVHDAIIAAKDVTELKSRIITYMADMMTECAQVIQHANAMKDDRICTCKDKCGD